MEFLSWWHDARSPISFAPFSEGESGYIALHLHIPAPPPCLHLEAVLEDRAVGVFVPSSEHKYKSNTGNWVGKANPWFVLGIGPTPWTFTKPLYDPSIRWLITGGMSTHREKHAPPTCIGCLHLVHVHRIWIIYKKVRLTFSSCWERVSSERPFQNTRTNWNTIHRCHLEIWIWKPEDK